MKETKEGTKQELQLRPKLKLELLLGENVVIDDTLASLLLLVKTQGSILQASKILGIPYSRAWERITKAERILGQKIIDTHRGGKKGGGAKLTKYGENILARFLIDYKRIVGRPFKLSTRRGEDVSSSLLVYAGSHDIIVEKIVGFLRDKGILAEAYWLGSVRGVAALMLGEADVAGIHIIDKVTGEYNIPYLKNLGYANIVLIRGYERLQGFITRREYSDFHEVLDDILDGKLRVVNRIEGSGTRILLEYVIERYARKKRLSSKIVRKIIRSSAIEAETHFDVASTIARREADVGIALKQVADLYGLNFIPLCWEKFDFVVRQDSLDNNNVQTFIGIIKSKLDNVFERLSGYRFSGDKAKIIRL